MLNELDLYIRNPKTPLFGNQSQFEFACAGREF